MGAYELPSDLPDVWINKYGPYQIAPGEEIVYQIYYGNSGSQEAKETRIVDTLPSGVSYISDTSGLVPSIVGQVITYDVGTLASTTYTYFELRGRVANDVTGQLFNTIEISSPDDSISYNNIATCMTAIFVPYLDLSICKWATNDALDRVFRAGDPIFYHISYYNSGSKKAENVNITDYLPAQMMYSTDTKGGIYSAPSHTVTWNIGEVSPGEHGYIKITGTIKEGVTGSFENTVTIYSTTPESAYYNNTATTLVTIGNAYDPNEKEVDREIIRANEIADLQYTIHFENIGNVAARDVRIWDRLDNNLDWSSLVILRQPALGPAGTFTINETTGEAYWHFDEIYLGTSCTDFIIFKIKTLGGIPDGTYIPNAADIGFDAEATMTTPAVYVRVIAFGTLSLTSNPTGANILINGTDTGRTTPAELSLQVGSYTLILTKTNYYPYTATFIINPNLITYIQATLTPTNLPDLTITKIHISPNRPIFEGDRINVVAWVKNIGTAIAEDIKIRFLDGTETQGERTINRLSPGQTQARQMNWRIYPFGTHTITVYADPDNNIPEIREDNNIRTQTIFVNKRPNKGLLMGTVSDKTTGNPLPDTSVIAIGKSFGLDITDSRGRYIIGDLIPGKYLVIAGRCGYIPQIKIASIHSSPPPNILNFELKKVKVEAELSFDELYSMILSSLKEDKTLSEEGIDPEFSAFSASALLSKEPVLLETPGTATLKLEGGVLKATLRNILVAKIETEAEIEQGDLLKERKANMLRTEEKEGITGEGILAKLKITPSEEPTQIQITCTFIDCEGNTFKIQETYDQEPLAPSVSELLQSFPNPANNGCYIPFKLSAESNVTVEVYNILGQKVRTIDAGPRKADFYTKQEKALFWNLTNDQGQKVASGLYFYQIKAGEFKATKAMVVR